ncbi:MAG: sugar phosphate isomerase/epimerase [Planctomycetaceae bacterium]
MPFKYSLNSSTIKPTPILKKIEVAADAGYGAIELWHADIDLHLEQGGTLEEIRQAVDASGLAVPTSIMLKGWCEPDGPELKAGIDECKRRLEQAAAVGAKHAIAGPPHGAVDFELAGQRYGELVDLGLTYGVRPTMEYLGFAQEVNTITAALTIMRNSGHPEATIVLDPFHDFRGGGGHDAILELRPDQIAMCHFDDAPASPPANEQQDPDRVIPGEGVIPLREFVSNLNKIGYTGWISLELFREDLWEADPLDVATLGLAAMKEICEPS